MAVDPACCRRYQISGKVQGVAYRVSARAEAERLRLSGWVRNLPDGRVEVTACGAEAALAAFAQWLRRGPPHAAVTTVTIEACTDPVGAGFHIR